jgi:hypothetical protein
VRLILNCQLKKRTFQAVDPEQLTDPNAKTRAFEALEEIDHVTWFISTSRGGEAGLGTFY